MFFFDNFYHFSAQRIESGALHDQSYFSERKNRMHCHVGPIYLKASIKYKLLNVFENI